MPTKKTGRGGRKRKYNKKRSNPYTLSRLGVPTARVVRMKYVDNVTLTSTSGVMAVHYFRANGLYDPDYTGTGHSPAGYTSMAALFNHYIVMGSKIKVTWSNDPGNTSGDPPTRCGVFLNDDVTLASLNYQDLIENGRGQSRLVGSGNANFYSTTSTTGTYSPRKFFNIVDPQDKSDTIGAGIAGNPSEEAIFAVWAQAIGGGSSTLSANIEIDFLVRFQEPTLLL